MKEKGREAGLAWAVKKYQSLQLNSTKNQSFLLSSTGAADQLSLSVSKIKIATLGTSV